MVEHLRLASDRESLDASEPEDDGLCPRCGHAVDMHRTQTMRCTAEVEDVELNSWMRCGCDMYPRVVWNESRSNGGQDD